MKNNRLKGIFLNLFAGICFGSFPVFSKFFTEFGGSATGFNFYTFLFSTVIMAVIVAVRRKSFILKKRVYLFVFILAFVNMLTKVFMSLSYNYIDVGISSTLHYFFPIFVAIWSALFFKERMKLYKWILFVIATSSVAFFITDSSSKANWIGIAIALGSGVSASFYPITMDKSGISHEDPFVLLFWLNLIGTACCYVMGIKDGGVLQPVPIKALSMPAVCALVDNTIAMTMQMIGMRYVEATTASIMGLTEPVFSCLFGAIILGEILGLSQLVGVVLVLASLAVMTLLDNDAIRERVFNKIKK